MEYFLSVKQDSGSGRGVGPPRHFYHLPSSLWCTDGPSSVPSVGLVRRQFLQHPTQQTVHLTAASPGTDPDPAAAAVAATAAAADRLCSSHVLAAVATHRGTVEARQRCGGTGTFLVAPVAGSVAAKTAAAAPVGGSGRRDGEGTVAT